MPRSPGSPVARSRVLSSISVSCSLSPSVKFFVDTSQSLAQIHDRIALAREQRVHAQSSLRRHFLEALSIQFVSDEYFALRVRQFVKRKFQLVQKQVAEVKRFRTGIGRWQQILEPKQFAFLPLARRVGERSRLLLAEQIGDAIARHPKKPAGHMLDWHQQSVGFDQLVEDVLQNVLHVARVRHSLANEIAQPGALADDYFGDPVILFSHWPRFFERMVHLLV